MPIKSPQSELKHLDRVLRLGILLRSFAKATWTLGLAGGTLLLSFRLFGLYLSPDPLWLLGLLAPLAWAIWSVWTRTPDARSQAGWLDHHRQLGGLLVTSNEVDLGPWRARLDEKLDRTRRADPALALAWPLLALIAPAILWTVLLLLPAPKLTSLPWKSLQAYRLEVFEEKLLKLDESKALDGEEIQKLQERLRALQHKMEQGEDLDWEEVDGLDRVLEQSKHDRLVKLQEALGAAKNLQESLASSDPTLADQQAPALQELLEKLEDAGILESIPPEAFKSLSEQPSNTAALELPPGLAMMLGHVDAKGEALPAGLPADMKALQELANQLGEACEGACESLAGEGLSAADLADLGALLDEYKMCFGEGKGALTGKGVGRGGVTEGPGHATLNYLNETEGDRSALAPRRLPKGRKPSTEWQTLGVTRGSPKVDPARSGGQGTAKATEGDKASHRRRLSPHHREVVRRFFTKTNAKQPRSNK